MTDAKQSNAFARSLSNAGLGDAIEKHKALVTAAAIMDGCSIEDAYMNGEYEVNALLIAFMPLPTCVSPNVEVSGSRSAQRVGHQKRSFWLSA